MYLSNMFFVHSDFYYESCKPVRFTSEGTDCGHSFCTHNVHAKIPSDTNEQPGDNRCSLFVDLH